MSYLRASRKRRPFYLARISREEQKKERLVLLAKNQPFFVIFGEQREPKELLAVSWAAYYNEGDVMKGGRA